MSNPQDSLMVHIEDLTMAFGAKTVLRGINLDVPQGGILGYIGPNGAGKTTTVKILIGMLGGFLGRVNVCGFNVALNPLEVKRRVGYVPETAALYDALTPMEFLAFVGGLHGMDQEEVEGRAKEMLGLFELSKEKDRRMNSFSKGMRQKVLIVASLIQNPDLIVMDEPLSGLDANSALIVKEILAELAGQGRTVFYCSHVMDVVERICDRIVILAEGRIVADGSFEELRQKSKASSLEGIFTRLTSEGSQKIVARKFVHFLEGNGGGRAVEKGDPNG